MPSPLWLQEEGPNRDVALSTRARLARNLADFPFPHRATPEQRRHAAQRIREAAKVEELTHLTPVRLSKLTDEARQALLAEQRLSPRMLLDDGLEERWALLDTSGALSILLHEEDHLRIQSFGAGCAPEETYARAARADLALQKGLTFATDVRLGYLTASLANVGSGLRLSVLLHLPALRWHQDLERHFSAVCALGGTVRGLRGEGSTVAGALYQVSHEITYRPEQGPLYFVRCVAAAADVLIQAERDARLSLPRVRPWSLRQAQETTETALTAAESLSAEEALEHLSQLRLSGLAGFRPALPPGAFADAVVQLHAEEGNRAARGRAGLLRRLERGAF